MEIAQGIYHFDTGPFNWYLIEEDSRLTLVDAGFPGHYSVFREGLAELGRTIADVEAVVITHAHADHTGFAQRVSREANAPVFIHEADVEKVKRTLQLPWWGLLSNAWRLYTAAMLGTAIQNGVFTFPSVPNAIPFMDNAILEVPGRPHILHVPGHTAGEVALYLPERGVLLSGDTLITRDLFTGERGSPQVPHRLLNANNREARRSLDRLTEVGIVTMLPGHGRAWQGEMAHAVALAKAQETGRRRHPVEGDTPEKTVGRPVWGRRHNTE